MFRPIEPLSGNPSRQCEEKVVCKTSKIFEIRTNISIFYSIKVHALSVINIKTLV
jgi:hypothetical protein